jgi:hypothetical protein
MIHNSAGASTDPSFGFPGGYISKYLTEREGG